MLLFVDFDDVLFNTKRFKKELIALFIKNGVSKKDFFLSYYDYPRKTKNGLRKYDPFRQIKILKKKNRFLDDKKIKKNLDLFLGNVSVFLFPDSKTFLKNFKKKNLILISYGANKFQKIKIKNSGLAKYFSRLIIGDKNKAELIKNFLPGQKIKEPVFLLEDHPLHIDSVKKKIPAIIIIRIKRKDGRYSKLSSLETNFEVKDLKEAIKIFKRF